MKSMLKMYPLYNDKNYELSDLIFKEALLNDIFLTLALYRGKIVPILDLLPVKKLIHK